jgi:hypothetical protein
MWHAPRIDLGKWRAHDLGARSREAARRHRRQALGLAAQALEPRVLLATFLVSNTNDSGTGSLRKAILDADASPAPNTIDFVIGSGAQTINLVSALPAVTNPVTLDGTTQPGYAGQPLIELNGASAGGGVNGLSITASGSLIRGLLIDRFGGSGIVVTGAGVTGDVIQGDVVSGNTGDGVFILTPNNLVAGNLIGTDATGSASWRNGAHGVEVGSGASGNTIGGTAAGDGNVIAGSGLDGIATYASGTLIQGNFIGTNAAGTAPLRNQFVGVWIAGPANAVSGNLISGNGNDGVGVLAPNNLIAGNLIGTDKTGMVVLGNGAHGVDLGTGATGCTIGGTTDAARNVIAGSAIDGVALYASGTLVEGNFIGTNATGTAPLRNQFVGVWIDGPANTVGGSAVGARNVISGNGTHGVVILAANNLIAGNSIGIDWGGATALGNLGNGVALGSNASGNTVGGTIAGAGNLISANTGQGVLIADTASDNLVAGNLIGTDITGTVARGNKTHGVALYGGTANTVGGTTLGARNVISGNAINGVDVESPGNVVTGNFIGTGLTGNVALGNGGFGIAAFNGGSASTIGGAAAGAGNVVAGNGNVGVFLLTPGNLVAGNFIGTNVGGTLALPNVVDGLFIATANNTVGGTAAGAGNLISGNARFGIDLNGAGATDNLVEGNKIGTAFGDGVALGNGNHGVLLASGASNNSIGGTTSVAANVISGNAFTGVAIVGVGTTSNLVEGNFVGTDPTGTIAVPNGGDGVGLGTASGNTVGGTASGAGNLISGNIGYGVSIHDGSVNNLVQGNFIGTATKGTAALGNGLDGVLITSASNTVGGNLVSGNARFGIDIDGTAATGNLVLGNKVGTDVTGSTALANGSYGLLLQSGAAVNTIGGTASGAGNLVSGNGSDGLVLTNAPNNLVAGNFIGTNAAGTAAVPNVFDALYIDSANNTVGGTAAGAGNLVSGNARAGIYLHGTGATGNLIQGNTIGTDLSGEVPLGNGNRGVLLEAGASNNTIGGTAPGAGNLISGNGGPGLWPAVQITDPGTTGDLVQGNKIGTDAAGAKAIGNTGDGVDISGASGNTVGGTDAGAGNLISGNGFDGLVLDNSATGNLVERNFVGTNATGTAALANSVDGVFIGSANNTLGGTTAGAGNLISGNARLGVYVLGAGATGDLIQGNKVGTDVTGRLALGNGNDGVLLQNGPSGDTITGNLISGNAVDGLVLTNAPSNLVAGNFIGTNAAGTAAVPNVFDALFIDSANNTVGGTATGAGNLVSGNARIGIYLLGTGATGNLVEGNMVGTDVTGTLALGNGLDGVVLQNGAANNTVGGTAAGAGNLVSGNARVGIYLLGAGATGDLVLGNKVGTDATGMAALGNGNDGVVLQNGAANNTVGGTAQGAGNLISGNALSGVGLLGTGTAGNLVEGNRVGTVATASSALPNRQDGVDVFGASGNTVGGIASGAGNVIAFNAAKGVVVGAGTTDTVTGDAILGNSIFANTAIGIDLGDDGVTPNESAGHTGPNLFQDFPVLSMASSDSAGTTVSGTVHGPANATLRVEVFFAPAADPSGHGQGQTLLGALLVPTDALGNGSFTFTSTVAVAPGNVLSATATDAGGNTSEFSQDVTVTANVTSQVSAHRSGLVYLRAAQLSLGILTITNTSATTIDGGFDVVLAGLTPGVTLKAAVIVVGTTVYNLSVSRDAAGDPIIHIPPAILAALPPGQSFSLLLVFGNPSKAPIDYTSEVFSDPWGG